MELIRQDADLVIRLLHQAALCPPIVAPKDRPLIVNLPEDRQPRKIQTESRIFRADKLLLHP